MPYQASKNPLEPPLSQPSAVLHWSFSGKRIEKFHLAKKRKKECTKGHCRLRKHSKIVLDLREWHGWHSSSSKGLFVLILSEMLDPSHSEDTQSTKKLELTLYRRNKKNRGWDDNKHVGIMLVIHNISAF